MDASTLAIILSLIATLGTIVAPILLLIVKSRLAKIDKHLEDVHKEIDGKVTMLLAANKLVDTAKGHEQGKAEARQENLVVETAKNTEAIKAIMEANKPTDVVVVNKPEDPVKVEDIKK